MKPAHSIEGSATMKETERRPSEPEGVMGVGSFYL